MTDSINAAQSRTFLIGGDISVHRLGFGSMRITGPGIWDEPEDREEALNTLRRLPELGVNFIDTADSYGPEISENLIREALHPYVGLLIATKGGLTRQGPDRWTPVGRPEYLRQAVMLSLRRLKVERLDLWQLHRIDPKVPREEQFEVIRDMREEGLIRHVGLSQVSIEEIEAAKKFFPVATVQNRYNLVDRSSEEVLDYCTEHKIGFIPWFPLAAGDLAKPGSVLDAVAKKMHAAPSQVALAWFSSAAGSCCPSPVLARLSISRKTLQQHLFTYRKMIFACSTKLEAAQGSCAT